MKLDNAKRAGYIKLIYMVIPLLILVGVALVYLLSDVKSLAFIGLGIGLLILFFVSIAQFKYNYIVFYAGPDKVQIRFKALTPFNNPNNSVKILAENLKNYEVKASHWGIRKSLHLFQQTPSGLAKYPGIGVTALTQDEIEKISKALDLILAMNKSKTQ